MVAKQAFLALTLVFSDASCFHINKDYSASECNIAEGITIGEISDPVHEASGLAVSRMNPGILYTHPDSGHGPHIFAMLETGDVQAEVVLEECTNHDWEDIAVSAHHVYVGDTGNNFHNRNNLRILRFPEPVIDGSAFQIRIPRSDITYLDFNYPDYNHDCEALAIDPNTHDLLFFTKDWDHHKSEVYRYPSVNMEAGKSFTLEHITTLPLLTVTGADISPSGNTLAITNLWEGFSYTKPDGMDWVDYLKNNQNSYCSLNLEAMEQMEAIAVTEEAYWSTSECGRCPIWFYARM